MIDNISTADIEALVAKHDLTNIQINGWVPLHKLCHLFNDVVDVHGDSAAQIFVAMGMKIAEQSEFPPETLSNLTIPIMIMGWNDHYRANHRGGTLPDITPKQISEREYELHMVGEEHPYPYDMTYGMVYGFCRTLLNKDTKFRVSYADNHSPYTIWEQGVILKVTWS